MQLGFSYIGLLFLIMLMVPNFIWTKNQPVDYEKYVVHESKVLLLLERIGEVLVSCISLLFADFNIRPWTAWSWWFVLAAFMMILYEIYWIRYFKSKKTMKDFYSSLLGIPVAGATLPVVAFFSLGIYGKNPFMMAAVMILGIGHIGIHVNHYREIQN